MPENRFVAGFQGASFEQQVRMNNDADPMQFPDRFSTVPQTIGELLDADIGTGNIVLAAFKV